MEIKDIVSLIQKLGYKSQKIFSKRNMQEIMLFL